MKYQLQVGGESVGGFGESMEAKTTNEGPLTPTIYYVWLRN